MAFGSRFNIQTSVCVLGIIDVLMGIPATTAGAGQVFDAGSGASGIRLPGLIDASPVALITRTYLSQEKLYFY